MPPYGRGGAGNIEASTNPSTITSSTSTNDKIASLLESQQQDAESYASTSNPSFQNQEYAHMGRGGAGNYYSPRELSETGKYEGSERSHVLGDGTPIPGTDDRTGGSARGSGVGGGGASGGNGGSAGAAKNYSGRGGAGNYSFGVEDSERKRYEEKQDEENKQDELRRQIQKGVEESLPRPEKARLVPGGEPY